MLAMIVLGLIAVVIGVIATATTVSVAKRADGDPVFRLTIVWPSGKETRWPR